MKRFHRLYLPVFLLIFSGGCATLSSPADIYQRIADRMQEKAKAKQLAKAMRKSEKEEKHKSKHCCENYAMEQGRLEEATETDVHFKMQNGIEFVDFNLDFDEIKELAKRQAKYDEEYKEAKEAWLAYEDERERRYLKLKREHAKLEANSTEGQGGCTETTVPNCCIPPLKEYVRSEPPKRRAVGIDEIPVTVRMNVKLDAGAPTFEQAKINRTFIPAKGAKEPCCPECGTKGCVDSCTSCGFKPTKSIASDLVPPAPGIFEKLGLSEKD